MGLQRTKAGYRLLVGASAIALMGSGCALDSDWGFYDRGNPRNDSERGSARTFPGQATVPPRRTIPAVRNDMAETFASATGRIPLPPGSTSSPSR